jgi:hypothetical protein
MILISKKDGININKNAEKDGINTKKYAEKDGSINEFG